MDMNAPRVDMMDSGCSIVCSSASACHHFRAFSVSAAAWLQHTLKNRRRLRNLRIIQQFLAPRPSCQGLTYYRPGRFFCSCGSVIIGKG